jgi:hypothetical protein
MNDTAGIVATNEAVSIVTFWDVEGDGTATATAKLHTMRLYVLST